MSVMSHFYSITIDQGIIGPGHGKEVVDGLNSVDEQYIYKLMSNVQLPGSNRFHSQIQMPTGHQNNGVNLSKKIQTNLTKEHLQKLCH